MNLIDSSIDWDRTIGTTITRGAISYNLADYWKYIDWEYHPDLNEYCETMVQKANFHLFTTKANMPYTSRNFRKNDYLVFGSETTGISEDFLRSQWDRACTIPIMNKHIRSLNLATSVGIVLYEAIRQVNGK